MSRKRTPNDSNSPFKNKEKAGGERRSQLGGQWKVPMFSGQWKVPMFGGPCKVPMLGGPLKASNVSWPMEGEGKTPFHFFPFSPHKFYFNLHFFL